jgi:hypothetical protein
MAEQFYDKHPRERPSQHTSPPSFMTTIAALPHVTPPITMTPAHNQQCFTPPLPTKMQPNNDLHCRHRSVPISNPPFSVPRPSFATYSIQQQQQAPIVDESSSSATSTVATELSIKEPQPPSNVVDISQRIKQLEQYHSYFMDYLKLLQKDGEQMGCAAAVDDACRGLISGHITVPQFLQSIALHLHRVFSKPEEEKFTTLFVSC